MAGLWDYFGGGPNPAPAPGLFDPPPVRVNSQAGVFDWLQQLLGNKKEEDWEPPVPPPLPPQDVLYRDMSRGTPAQNARRDMEIVAVPRPPSENIDELIRHGEPGTADHRMLIGRDDLSNAQFNFAPGYLRKTSFEGPQQIDPSIVEILRKYGILPPLAAGGALGFSQQQ